MKKVFLVFVLTFLFKFGFSQKLKINSESQITIDTIVTFDSLSSVEIYNGIKKWSSANFNNIKEVTIYDTPDEIQFRYIQNVENGYGSSTTPIKTTLTIKIKTGKIRAEFSKMSWAEHGNTYESVLIKNDGTFRDNKPSRSMLLSTENNFITCIQNIYKAIMVKEDNW
jgi:hypothetical protein